MTQLPLESMGNSSPRWFRNRVYREPPVRSMRNCTRLPSAWAITAAGAAAFSRRVLRTTSL